MRSMLWGLLLGLISLVSALSAQGNKLLVVLDSDSDKTKYSQFWSDLQSRGFQITYSSPKDTSLSLFQHGAPAYSHLLLLPVKVKGLGPSLSPNLIVEFINAGSNILLALSSEQPVQSALNSLLLELDVTLPADKSSVVVDHFNYDTKSAQDKHDVLLVSGKANVRKAAKDLFSVDGLVALPHAVGHTLGNASPLLSSIIKAPATAYSYNTKDEAVQIEELFAPGSQINLVSAFEGRNSARFTILGSAEALEDAWFDASVQLPAAGAKSEKSGNRAFARRLASWAFKETGVLKVGQIQHYLNEGAQKDVSNATALSSSIDLNPSIYRIKNDVYYSIEISEWDVDHWIPFTPPTGDHVQLEFSMLSPFHRLNLEATSTTASSTIFSASFRLPDQHGIFNFFVEYRRPFFTNLEEKRTVTVRHFAHDEWPRSFVISGAWPWVSGVWVTVAGWLAFCAVWLYSKPVQEKSASAKR